MIYRGIFIMLIVLLPVSCGTHHFFQQAKPFLSLTAASLPPVEQLVIPESIEEEFLNSPQPKAPNLPDEISLEAFEPQLDKLFKSYQKKYDFSGNVLIAEAGKIVHTGSYGYGNLETKEELTLDSEFQLASVSKMFTAAAIMLLYEDGLLNLDDEVRYYIPEFPYKGLTIRHLLTHRSGLCRYMGFAQDYWDRRKFMSYLDVMDYLIEKKPGLWFKPGSEFRYINTNYVVLAGIVDYISEMPFEQFLQKRIFDPLGMKNTYLGTHFDHYKRENHTVGYKKAKRGYKQIGGDYLDGVMGDKGVYSTLEDLYRFDQALYGERMFKQATLTEAFSPSSNDGEGRSYGFGWRMKSQYPDLVYHFGWWRGYRTCFIRDLQAEKTVIVLSNKDNPGRVINFWQAYYVVNDWMNPS